MAGKTKMKSKSAPKQKDFEYDDDTDDSSSDDDQIESFKKQLNKSKSNKEIENSSDDDESDGDDDSEDSLDDEDSNEGSPEKEPRRFVKPEPDAKLLKLKAQLDSIKNCSGDESQSSVESSSEAESDDEQSAAAEELEFEVEKNVVIEKSVKKIDKNFKGIKRPADENNKNVATIKKLKTSDLQEDDEERLAFKTELSKMSIEEIQALKEKIGLKVYNKAIGVERTEKKKFIKSEHKRENKNRPREVSSKVKVPRLRDVVGLKSGMAKKEVRDPRFDAFCGEFDEKLFHQSYKFVDELKTMERGQLQKELQTEEDPERMKQIKYLIQRMDNQEREKNKVNKAKADRQAERTKNKELLKEGKKPIYISNAERKAKELVDKYEELTQTGKLDNYIKRKEKKNLSKERKKLKL